jgi:hypothetical protein
MTARHYLLALTAAFACSSAAPGIALADYTITTTAKGGMSELESLSWTFNGQSETGLAGTLSTTLNGTGQQFDTYCVDLYHDFTPGSSWSVDVVPISSYQGESGVAKGDNPGGNAGAIGYLYDKFASQVTTAIEGAALQVAIWKVDYDDNNSLSTGSFRFAPSCDPKSVQSQVYDQAMIYLAGFNGTQASTGATYLMATSHPNGLNQDFVGPGGSVSPFTVVPEPSSIVLVVAGLGLGAAGARGARRKV